MAESAPDLETLLRHPGIWRIGRQDAGRADLPAPGHVASGFSGLDAVLPGGGWPAVGVTEILRPRNGSGELAVLAHALATLTRAGRRIAWVAPPLLPYAPGLAAAGLDLARLVLVQPPRTGDVLWVVEQVLRSGSCGAVLAWPLAPEERGLRRLQLAAEQGECWGVLFGAPDWLRHPSPAVLRVGVAPAGAGGLQVRVHKCRGGAPAGPLRLVPREEAAGVASPDGAALP